MHYRVAVALVLLVAMFHSAVPQRPPYAPDPLVYPNTLAQFGGSQSSGGGGRRVSSGLDNRFDDGSNSVSGTQYQSELVNRVATWPRERQPYWYVNNRQLSSHIGLL